MKIDHEQALTAQLAQQQLLHTQEQQIKTQQVNIYIKYTIERDRERQGGRERARARARERERARARARERQRDRETERERVSHEQQVRRIPKLYINMFNIIYILHHHQK